MAGWTVSDIQSELTSIASMLDARTPPADSGEAIMAAYNKLGSSMIASLCSKIAGIHVLDAAGAFELMKAVIQAKAS